MALTSLIKERYGINIVLTISVLSKFIAHLMEQESGDSAAGGLVSKSQIALSGQQTSRRDFRSPGIGREVFSLSCTGFIFSF